MPELIAARSTFLASLKPRDLQRLHTVAYRIMADLGYPTEMRTAREADRMVEAYGPRVAEAVIKTAVDRGLVE